MKNQLALRPQNYTHKFTFPGFDKFHNDFFFISVLRFPLSFTAGVINFVWSHGYCILCQ